MLNASNTACCYPSCLSYENPAVCAIVGPPSAGDRPLTAMELKWFQIRRSDLLAEIDLSGGLLDRLYSTECISREHKANIEQRVIEDKKISRLLDIMESRSFAHYTQFLNALRETSQDHVVQVLETSDAVMEQLQMGVSGEKTLELNVLRNRRRMNCILIIR